MAREFESSKLTHSAHFQGYFVPTLFFTLQTYLFHIYFRFVHRAFFLVFFFNVDKCDEYHIYICLDFEKGAYGKLHGFGQNQAKAFYSHGPANCSDATEVTHLLRRKGEREEEKRKSQICTPSLYIDYFRDFWTRKNYLKQGFLLRVRFRKSGQIYISKHLHHICITFVFSQIHLSSPSERTRTLFAKGRNGVLGINSHVSVSYVSIAMSCGEAAR